jgi:hypothetical protein
VAEGLDTLWSFAILPDGRIILDEKPGLLRLLDDGVLSAPVRGAPIVAYRQDAGLLALTLLPDFDENGWIYLPCSSSVRTPPDPRQSGSFPPAPELPTAIQRHGQPLPDTPGTNVIRVKTYAADRKNKPRLARFRQFGSPSVGR